MRVRKPNRVSGDPRVEQSYPNDAPVRVRPARWAAAAERRNRYADVDGNGAWHRRPTIS
jgi:hypothetical protein